MTPLCADPFDRVFGRGRGSAEEDADVLLVEDLGHFGFDWPIIAVFATRSRELAEQIAAVHSRTHATSDRMRIRIRSVPLSIYEQVRDADELGPGELDRCSPEQEAEIMSVHWPLNKS